MAKAGLRLVHLPSVSPRTRYVMAVVLILISLHYILAVSHEDYGRSTSMSSILGHLGVHSNESSSAVLDLQPSPLNITVPTEPFLPQIGSANAVLVFLCRNEELEGVVSSMRQLEDRFNRKYNYPWVFLNDNPFTEDFKQRVRVLSNAKMEFGLIPPDHWNQPDWIDEDKASRNRQTMINHNIIYGGSVAYRNMCRFNSGFFYRHELLQPYKYYWRVEPGVQFFCDVAYDPFEFMQQNNKTYGFTLSMLEHRETVATLWTSVREFVRDHPEYVAPDNALRFLSSNRGRTYNMCHFWSNFEIADMDFWRDEAYSAFFDFLDSKGGFYYERWGDAPVHSIAAALFANKDELHFFNDIGYQHDSFGHCPQGDAWSAGRCSCNPEINFDYTKFSCLRRFERLWKI